MSDDQQDNNESKEERKFNQKQYDMLKRCSDKKDMTEWNDWRVDNPNEDILLKGARFYNSFLEGVFLATDVIEGYHVKVHLENTNFNSAKLRQANLSGALLNGSDFRYAHLQGAQFIKSHIKDSRFRNSQCSDANFFHATLENTRFTSASLERARFNYSNLRNSNFLDARLQDTIFYKAELQGANLRTALTTNVTSFWEIKIDKKTNFSGVGLGAIRIHPGTKQLLEYNIRRRNWEDWYKQCKWYKPWQWPVRNILVRIFWLMSDYGRSILRIAISFFLLAFLFALVYWKCPAFIAFNGKAEIENFQNFWHALYFSVVTMTTLGFGDIAANQYNGGGKILLMIQVLLGYVMLGALVTRFAVLFTAGGPAGKFSDE